MTFPENVVVTVTINGTDVTDYIKPGSLRADDKITNKVKTIAMTLEDSPIVPVDWQEIIYLSGSTKIFGGYVITPDDEDGAVSVIDTSDSPGVFRDFDVSGSDYSIRLEKIRVKEQYLNKTDAYVLNDIFTKYLAAEGFEASTYVTSMRTHPVLKFNRMTVADIIKQLAGYSGAEWSIDVDKKLHYMSAGVQDAAFNVSDAPDMVTTFPYFGLTRKKDGSGVVNRIEVIGGTFLSADTTFYLSGNGVDSRISVPFRFHAPTGYSTVQIWRNDGSFSVPAWTLLTTLAGYIDELTNTSQVLYYYNEKVIEQLDPFPALQNAIKIIAQYDVPLRVRVVDDASYLFYGMYFDDVITESNINSRETAKMMAKAQLAQKSLSSVAITFSVNQPGLKAGTRIHVKNTLRGIDGYFLIQSIKPQVTVNGKYKAVIDVGTYNSDLIDLLKDLYKKVNASPEWADDEVLDEIFQKKETVTMTESYTVNTGTHGPYYISPDLNECCTIGFCMIEP